MKKSFTLIELLIVVGLLVTLAITLLVTLNPWGQINKGQDSKRKLELTQLNKVFEDYYNDKGCYPKPNEVCYPNSQSGYNPQVDTKCYICGHELPPANFANFSPYMARLPCDPRHPTKKYLYQVDSLICPSLYRGYTYLSYSADPATKEYCSGDGSGETDYNWGVASSNSTVVINCLAATSTPIPPAPTQTPTQTPSPIPTTPPTPTPTPTPNPNLYCSSFSTLYILSHNICNICGNYQQCQADYPTNSYYIDPGGGGFLPGCSTPCIKD
ncbi:MAG: type II secretion system protein [Patescibacteria group bacterium]